MTRLSKHRLLGLALTACTLGTSLTARAADSTEAAQAADASARLAAAGQLVDIMHLDKQLEGILPQVISLMMNSLVRGNTGHESEIRQILGEELNEAFIDERPALMQVYRETYARNLTLEELKAMTDFYKSNVGQAVLAKMPKLTQDSMQNSGAIGERAAMKALPHIFERMQAAKLEVPKGT